MAGHNCLVALVVCSYWLVASTMIFINKYLMASTNPVSPSIYLPSDMQTAEAKFAFSPPFVEETLSNAVKRQQKNSSLIDSDSKSSRPSVYVRTSIRKPANRFQTYGLSKMRVFDTEFQVERPETMKTAEPLRVSFMPGTVETKGKKSLRFSKYSDKTKKTGFIDDYNKAPLHDNKQTLSHDRKDMGPDISVLVVWAQNVFGLTSLLALKGIVVVLGLPVKELTHLQLPSAARRGDLGLVLAAVAQTSALIFNNLTLRLINVSFYQIARALTLVFVTLLSACILRERIAKRVAIACLLMILGFYVGVDQEVLSHGVLPVGVLYGSVASFFAACYGVLFKRLQLSSTIRPASSNGTTSGLPRKIMVNLQQREKELTNPNKFLNQQNLTHILSPKISSQWKHHEQYTNSAGSTASRITATTLQFTYYNYLTCSIALAPAVFGSCQAREFLCTDASRDFSFWCLLILSGIAGIAMSWVSSLQISLTSPLTHNISINAKSVLLTLTAVIWNGEQRTGLWWAGNAFVIGGVALYTATKLQEQVKLADNRSVSDTTPWPRASGSRRLKVPIPLAAVAEDVRY